MTTIIVLTIISYILTGLLRFLLEDSYKEMHKSMKILALVPCGSFIIVALFILWAANFKK